MTLSGKGSGTKRRWTASAIGAAGAIAIVLLLFRVPAAVAPVRSARPDTPPITLAVRGDNELIMRDLAPLFLPTRFNAPPQVLRPPEPGGGFFDRDATVLKYGIENPALDLQPPVSPPAGPVEAVIDSNRPLALGLGRSDATVEPLPATGGRVTVFAEGRRDSMFGVSLPPDVRPKSATGAILTWRPLEFVAAVDSTGLVGNLALTSSSEVEEVDNFFRNYLAQSFRLGERLPPGFYRVVVAP